MHYSEEKLRAYIDGEISREQAESMDWHLRNCQICSSRLELTQKNAAFVHAKLLRAFPEDESKFSSRFSMKDFLNRKEGAKMQRWYQRPVWIGVMAIVLLAIAMLFTPVRALASNFLNLFRVEQVRVVSFDPAMLGNFKQSLSDQQEQISQYLDQNMVVVRNGQFKQVENANQASRLVGFFPRLPAGSTVMSIGVIPEQTHQLTVDADLWNAVLASLGSDRFAIDPSLDGQIVKVSFKAAVTTAIGQCEKVQDNGDDQAATILDDCIVLVEMPGPTVEVPEGLDIMALTEALLELTGMSAEEARTFSQNVDWATTLILPVPNGDGVTSRDIVVDSVTGTLIEDSASGEFVLIWNRDGLLYSMAGSGDPQVAIDLASNLTQ